MPQVSARRLNKEPMVTQQQSTNKCLPLDKPQCHHAAPSHLNRRIIRTVIASFKSSNPANKGSLLQRIKFQHYITHRMSPYQPGRYRYHHYGAGAGIGAAAAIVIFLGWRFSQLNWSENQEGAIIAGIVIAVAIIAGIAIYAVLLLRRGGSMTASDNEIRWHPWMAWSRKQKARIREEAGVGNRTEQQRQRRIQQFNEERSAANMHSSNGYNNTTNFDVESGAADASLPEKPPPAYPGGKGDRTYKDPNPTSMLDV